VPGRVEEGLQPGLVPAGHGDAVAAVEEHPGGAGTDPAGCAGDQDGLVGHGVLDAATISRA
jgi:hypothetical protein